ncbi:MAG TPA: tetratricopeptide repeat protein, partial [Acidobacteriaceae bacterium]|nr:tetratricopeptide repeat protein [Acidobacteriaceae bacterium]
MPSRKAAFSVRRSAFTNTILSFAVPAIILVGGLTALKARPAAGNSNPAEAARLNSIGVALMNQQLTEKAAAELDQARAADPKSPIPVLNRGIALLYMQKLPEAEAALRQAGTMAPDNPRAWYNLGLTEMDEANQKGAIEDMRKVLAIDPKDADAHYFVGSLEMSLGDANAAIAEFQTALKLNPLHCSAEFGLARALQRAGRVEEAHEHLKIFQHFTQAKIAAPLSVGYGERGHYSKMEEMQLPVEAAGPMIPVKF